MHVSAPGVKESSLPECRSVIIAGKGKGKGKGKGIRRLEDIGGLEVAFGDPKSTLAHLAPGAVPAARGLLAGKNYRVMFLGSHDKVALAVQ